MANLSILIKYPFYWFIDLIESLFPTYKIVLYHVSGTPHWGINKRKWLLFRSALCHHKSVIHGPHKQARVSYEILTYPAEEDAQSEIDRLSFGYPPVTGRRWENGKMTEEYYAVSND